jgi:hypothetical protein
MGPVPPVRVLAENQPVPQSGKEHIAKAIMYLTHTFAFRTIRL